MGLSFASESLFHFHFFSTFCLAKSSNFELSEVLSLHIVSLFQFFFRLSFNLYSSFSLLLFSMHMVETASRMDIISKSNVKMLLKFV